MADRSVSTSEQYVKKSNRTILFVGLGLLLIFMLAYCSMSGGNRRTGVVDDPLNMINDQDPALQGNVVSNPDFSVGGAVLKATPDSVTMNSVVLGSQAEAIVTLTAQNAPVFFLGIELAETQQDGFLLGGTCTPTTKLVKDGTCTIKIMWNPVTLRQIQNTLNIRWREDNPAVFRDEKLSLQLTAQSTDSKDCVICESPCKDKEAEKARVASLFNGAMGEVGDDGKVIIDGKEYLVKGDLLIDPESGEIVGIVEPEKIPLGLDNKLLGTISKARDVLAPDGKSLGRLLGDDTIVDSTLKVVGAAVPVVSVMDDQGRIIGKTMNDGTVIDGTGSVIGQPLVDGSVIDLEGTHIGYLRPYGLVINFVGNVIGGVVSDGTVVNADQQVIGTARPNGFIVSPDGELIGGVVPQGVAVGAACKALGTVLQNGVVRDQFSQSIGRILLDGSVIDDAGNELGSVVSQGLVIDEVGHVVGFVNSEGKAVDAKGSVIGCVNPDGTVAAGTKVVGAVMPKGRVIGRSCTAVGSVYPNGVVMNAAIEVVGQVRPDSYVVNINNKIVGVVVPRGSAIADGCRLLGLITLDGQVVDSNGTSVGCMTLEKKVANRQDEEIGFVAPKGVVVDKTGKVIGRVRLDGKVMDLSGKIIGCVNSDGTVISLDGKTVLGHILDKEGNLSPKAGVILDANGDPTGWTVVGNDVYDENGKKIGTLQPNGWVVNSKGEIIGVIPPDGVIVSHDGLILGRYSQKTGVALTLAGERFGVVLPDYSVLDGAKENIIGLLIPDKTSFMDMNGNYLATMNLDGILQAPSGEAIGVVKSNGTVINRAGQVIGSKIPQGDVFSVSGQKVGTVTEKGEVVSEAQSVIGRILGNGIAIGNDGRILGGVFPDISIPFASSGVLGSLTINGRVNDLRGHEIAIASPFGSVFGDSVAGKLVRVGPYISSDGKLVGWTSFKGELNDKTGSVIGSITMSGIALDKDGVVIGSLVPRGSIVSNNGSYMGGVASNGQVITPDGQNAGFMIGGEYLSSDKDGILGRLLQPGIVVDADGGVIGWTQFDGAIDDINGLVGRVSLSSHVLHSNGSLLGVYVPLGTQALSTSSNFLGVVDGRAAIVNKKGEKVASIANDLFVMNDGRISGRLLSSTLTINQNLTGKLVGYVAANAEIMSINDNRTYGNLMANGLVSDLTKKVVGGLAPVGLSIGTKLNVLGRSFGDGRIINKGAFISAGIGTGIGATYTADGQINGGIMQPGIFIDKNGIIIGHSSGTSTILDRNGKKLAEYMAFGSALTADTVWAGGVMPLGLAVNDDGYDIGVVAVDGAVEGKDNSVMGRVLSDGTVVGLSDRSLYTTMPYAGHLVKQGLPFSYKNVVLGRTTVNGDVIDAMDKKVYRELDDGTILGNDMPLDGSVLSFNPATAQNGSILGVLDGAGSVISFTGEEMGQIAVNGAVKGNHKYKILGALIPEPLVANDCKVVGQTSFNGQVVNGKGVVVGRVNPDKWAVDSSDNKIGRVVRVGLVASPEGDYLGRTLPDSSVVDLNGVNMGCARNDGSVVNNSGDVIGHVVERGLVLDEKGNPIGRVKADGTVVDKNGKAIGKVLGDGKGTVVDSEGKVIGRVVTPDEELMFNKDGSVSGTFRRDGMFKDPKGVEQFQVLPDGRIIDPKTGKQIATLTEDGRLLDMNGNEISDIRVLRDADGNFIGLIDDDGNILNFDGEIIGKVLPDGTILDNNGNVIGKLNPDGTITLLTPDGTTTLGTFTGDLNTIAPEMDKTSGQGSGGRRIFLGDKVFDVTPQGSLVDKDGNIIGYMGEDGRPYSLDNRLLVGGSADDSGRVVPDVKQKTRINPEQAAAMDELLSSRRAEMKKKITSFERLLPDGRTLARARKKEDPDWGEGKIVSTYPVDMSRMILKDKAIPAVLVHSIDSRYSNTPVTAIVERHIYAEEGRRIIIPAGSRLIGTGGGGGGDGGKHVNKLEITWTRLIRPDGSAFKFSANSGDAQGRGGIAAYLDEQLLKKYGKPVLSSTLTSAIAFITATNDDITNKENGDQVQSSRSQAASDARSNFIDSMSEIFQRLLEEATETEDVVFVPAGTRITVFPNEDLWLRSEVEDEEDYNARFGVDGKSAKGTSGGNWEAARKPEMDEVATQYGASVGTGLGEEPVDEYYDPDMSDETEELYNGNDSYESSAEIQKTPVKENKSKPKNTMTQPIFPSQPQSNRKLF